MKQLPLPLYFLCQIMGIMSLCSSGYYLLGQDCTLCPHGKFMDIRLHQERACKIWTVRPYGYHWVLKSDGTTTKDRVWGCKTGYIEKYVSKLQSRTSCFKDTPKTPTTETVGSYSVSLSKTRAPFQTSRKVESYSLAVFTKIAPDHTMVSVKVTAKTKSISSSETTSVLSTLHPGGVDTNEGLKTMVFVIFWSGFLFSLILAIILHIVKNNAFVFNMYVVAIKYVVSFFVSSSSISIVILPYRYIGFLNNIFVITTIVGAVILGIFIGFLFGIFIPIIWLLNFKEEGDVEHIYEDPDAETQTGTANNFHNETPFYHRQFPALIAQETIEITYGQWPFVASDNTNSSVTWGSQIREEIDENISAAASGRQRIKNSASTSYSGRHVVNEENDWYREQENNSLKESFYRDTDNVYNNLDRIISRPYSTAVAECLDSDHGLGSTTGDSD